MQTKTIGLIIVLAAILTTFKMKAQDSSKVKEFGVGIAALNGLGVSLQYRWGNEQRLFRISGNVGGFPTPWNSKRNSINSRISNYPTLLNLNYGLNFSIFKIKSVSEHFGFLYGGVCAFTYFRNQYTTIQTSEDINNNSTSTLTINRNSQAYMPAVGIALGAVYKINASFLVYAEIDPNLYYIYNKSISNRTTSTSYSTYTTSETTTHSGSGGRFGFSDLSNSFATLTIVYRIVK